MARPIKETPILFGNDARRFEERMKNPPKETPEEKERRLKHYHTVLQWFENGKKYEDELRASKNPQTAIG
ncbi:hypothetical protein [Bacteroides timonensis]|uniref:hypothetical protein n=1 Tax=Bacteroides timonensis TaxID=1470345 RepID=UPI0004B4571C|nr:hypothetical protein [Bacteroides timonensis]